MTLILDSGALVALDRNERPMWVRLKAALAAGEIPLTHAGVLGQVWRSDPRQARLNQALRGIEIAALDEGLARHAGRLLAITRTSDVIDAAVVGLANDGDVIVTSDTSDLGPLAHAHGRHVEIIRA